MPIDATAVQNLPNVPCIDRCTPPGMQMAVLIALACKWGGLSTDPVVLQNNAVCFQSCIPRGAALGVLISLATQLTACMIAPVACTDTDANAFISAAGITDATQKSAVCTLVTSLKSGGVWTLMDAVYPFVGGTSASCAVNLKSPGTYNITWHGGVTFTAGGVTGDGTSGYGDTGMNPATAGGNYSLNSAVIGVNIATNNSESAYVMGIVYTSSAALQISAGAENLIGLNSIQIFGATPSTLAGFLAGSVTDAFTETLYLTDGTTATHAPVPTAIPSFTVGVLARNFAGTFNQFSSQTLSFAFIGGGLTGTQVAALKSAVVAFNTTLGRP